VIVGQVGLVRDRMTVDSTDLTLKSIKTFACSFISEKFPEHGVTRYTNSPHLGPFAVFIRIYYYIYTYTVCRYKAPVFPTVLWIRIWSIRYHLVNPDQHPGPADTDSF
jgi:hypothetical protein